MNPIPFLLVAGLPATGKTTVCERLVNATSSRPHISIDHLLRLQCPDGSAAFAGENLYERQGERFLLSDTWRPTQMTLAVRGQFVLADLRQQWDRTRSGPCEVLELPANHLSTAADEIERRRLQRGVLVILNSSTQVRWRRNQARAAAVRLPGHVMRYFDQANSIDEATVDALQGLGWRVVDFLNDEDGGAAIDKTVANVTDILPRQWFEHN